MPKSNPLPTCTDFSMIPIDVLQKFDNLCSRLSPENLCCDGEIPSHMVKARANQIYREWEALEKQIGMRIGSGKSYGVMEMEIYCLQHHDEIWKHLPRISPKF
jgi:hypothetical protein